MVGPHVDEGLIADGIVDPVGRDLALLGLEVMYLDGFGIALGAPLLGSSLFGVGERRRRAPVREPELQLAGE